MYALVNLTELVKLSIDYIDWYGRRDSHKSRVPLQSYETVVKLGIQASQALVTGQFRVDESVLKKVAGGDEVLVELLKKIREKKAD
jgi:hypothetical protein